MMFSLVGLRVVAVYYLKYIIRADTIDTHNKLKLLHIYAFPRTTATTPHDVRTNIDQVLCKICMARQVAVGVSVRKKIVDTESEDWLTECVGPFSV